MNTYLNFSTINGEKIVLPCQTIEVNEPVIVVKTLLDEKSNILFLEVKHNQINTLLDLTSVTPYELWYFDQEKIFTGKCFSLQNPDQLFQIQTQAQYLALIPRENERVTVSKLLTNFNCHSFKTTIEDSFALNAFLKGYGLFPYIIIKTGNAIFTQVPININKNNDVDNFPGAHFNDVSDEIINAPEQFRDFLIDSTREIKGKIENDRNGECKICLVIGPSEGYYIIKDEIKKSDNIPSGGTLLTQRAKVIAMNRNHYLDLE